MIIRYTVNNFKFKGSKVILTFKASSTLFSTEYPRNLFIYSKLPDKMDHLGRTANNSRQNEISKAKVTSMSDLSSTVKGLTLQVCSKDVTFKAGQWVDFIVPSINKYTGFTMCSSPAQLANDQTLSLAIKKSDHPVTSWVHLQCTVGSEVSVRVGGDFYYDPAAVSSNQCLLLIAGGVGINPLISILRHIADLQQQSTESPTKAYLLYSAKSADELIFMHNLEEMMCSHPNIRCQFFVTGSTAGPGVHNGRIRSEHIKEAVQWFGCEREQVHAFICGPGPMINDMCQTLTQLALPDSSLHFEKWW